MTITWPLIVSACADCGIGTIRIGEWYMVQDSVWEQAWAGRRKAWHGKIPGQEILCIGCLEKRLGRTLTAFDFTDAEARKAEGLEEQATGHAAGLLLGVLPGRLTEMRRVPEPPLGLGADPRHRAVPNLAGTSQALRDELEEGGPHRGRQRAGSAVDGVELRIGESERRHGHGSRLRAEEIRAMVDTP
jgi:hypothetical protein